MKPVTAKELNAFQKHLIADEKSPATQEKYLRNVRFFVAWLGKCALTQEAIVAYKAHLMTLYSPAAVNAALASLRAFFAFLGKNGLRVKNLKIQRAVFAPSEKELTKSEYGRLLQAAKACGKERLYLLMQTVCSTGIRISELQFITAEAVRRGYADVQNKGKLRRIFLPKSLCRMLASYLAKQKQKSGAVFVTKTGHPLDRSNIWSDMKKLCAAAYVSPKKVFPHNLRHLFARTYYAMQKDIVRLADLLGHASINTTRIYTMESGAVHQKQIERLGLLRC